MTDNQNSLAEYVQTGSDAAFRELVSRYVDLVYSTALRFQRATKIAVPALVEALKDPDPLVRANAALTLGYLREELDVIIPALAAALNDKENRVALSAAKALGRLQTIATNAIPSLLQAALSSDGARREAAINALKQIGPESLRKAGLIEPATPVASWR